MITTTLLRTAAAAVCLGAITGLTTPAARATVVSDNLTATTGGTESATTTRWLAAGFTTDASSHTLSSVTLLLANPAAGAASVAIYSNGGLEPGALVGVLVSPPGYSAGAPAAATFTTAGIALSASTTYWVVLTPQSGDFSWAWATSNTGTGTGFTHAWANSDDAGGSWWSTDIYPLQMTVAVDACTSPSVNSSPSSSSGCAGRTVTFSAAGAGSPALGYQWRRNTVALTNGGRISGATGTTLQISGVVAADPGTYDCVISNSCGSATSAGATLAVCVADVDCDGQVTPADVAGFVNVWFSSLQNGTLEGDLDGNGSVTPADIAAFVNIWFGSLTSGC